MEILIGILQSTFLIVLKWLICKKLLVTTVIGIRNGQKTHKVYEPSDEGLLEDCTNLVFYCKKTPK